MSEHSGWLLLGLIVQVVEVIEIYPILVSECPDKDPQLAFVLVNIQ